MHHDSTAYNNLWTLIKDIRFGMLTHRTATGMLHAHPLTTQNRDFDESNALYFFIPRSGELCQRLRTDAQVNVSYADPGADSYVSLSGDAHISEDMALKERLWSPAAKAWFPGGVTDPDLALVVVHVRHAEYWDVKEAKITQLFKMARAVITGEQPRDLGEHKELTLS